MLDKLPPAAFAPIVGPDGSTTDVMALIEDFINNLAQVIADGVMEGVEPTMIASDEAGSGDSITMGDVIGGEGLSLAGAGGTTSAAYFIDVSTWKTALPTAGAGAGISSGIFAETPSTTVAGYVYKAYGAEWQLAQANTVETTSGSLAIAVGVDPSDDGLIASGFVRIPSGAIDATADAQLRGGVPIFLSATTPGGIQANVPQSAGNIVRPVGVILAYDLLTGDALIHFNPDTTYMEISG